MLSACLKQMIPLKFKIVCKSEKQVFYLPDDSYGDISGSVHSHENCDTNKIYVDMIDFNKVLEIVGEEDFEILKMDIEGSEFDIIEDILNSTAKIKQICIEFHQRFFKKGGRLLKNTIKDMHRAGYNLVYVSDTNMEYTFIKEMD